jgi:hypothetical protein
MGSGDIRENRNADRGPARVKWANTLHFFEVFPEFPLDFLNKIGHVLATKLNI